MTHLKFFPLMGGEAWRVKNKHDMIFLGSIEWFPKWRKYGFFPKADTVYEEVCLRDIAAFCEELTKSHRRKS